eukprot:scaffold6692_cov107-Isochrysis_galbana.AAC.2
MLGRRRRREGLARQRTERIAGRATRRALLSSTAEPILGCALGAAHPLPPAPQPPPWGWWHGCHLYPLAAAAPASQARESDAPTFSSSAAAYNANRQPQTRV